MKVCPNCDHHIYDESLTICPYCIEKLPTEEESEEDAFINQLEERTRSGDDAANSFLSINSVLLAIASVILGVCAFLYIASLSRYGSEMFILSVVTVILVCIAAMYVIIRNRMIGHMAQDMHTTASVNLMMLRYKIDEINKNQARLTEAEKQEFLSEQTISEIRDEIDGIETQYEIASFEQDLSSKEEKTQTEERRYMKEVERRYTARIKQASDSIIPLENEIMGFYEQFLQIVDARKNPIEPAPSGRRRRQS